MTTSWDDNLDTAISDWNASSVMNVVKEAGDDSSNVHKRCRPVSGKVRACNANYGNIMAGWGWRRSGSRVVSIFTRAQRR